ncbi:MAG: AAA family ATPase [Christensenellaceae bacterium]
MYSSAQFYTKKLREPVDIKNIDEILSPDATNFSNIFNNYKSKDFLWKNRFEARIKELIPELQAADTVTFYDKLIFRLAYYDEQYDLSDISEGTIKGLILNLLINMPLSENCPLLAIDEPESNLHPAWQKVIGNWIQTSDTFDQCY